jgi:hypothetical protein
MRRNAQHLTSIESVRATLVMRRPSATPGPPLEPRGWPGFSRRDRRPRPIPAVSPLLCRLRSAAWPSNPLAQSSKKSGRPRAIFTVARQVLPIPVGHREIVEPPPSPPRPRRSRISFTGGGRRLSRATPWRNRARNPAARAQLAQLVGRLTCGLGIAPRGAGRDRRMNRLLRRSRLSGSSKGTGQRDRRFQPHSSAVSPQLLTAAPRVRGRRVFCGQPRTRRMFPFCGPGVMAK